METANRKYIITGGPGSGKSTLVAALELAGYTCSAEISRQTIKAEVAKGSECLPWLDILCFSSKVIYRMMIEWTLNHHNSLTFFDRGIPDVIAYIKIANLPVPSIYEDNLIVHSYQKQVFILPPWREIYVNDSERWQSFEEAAAIYQAIRETYIFYGYDLIEVPCLPEAERVAFVLGYVNNPTQISPF